MLFWIFLTGPLLFLLASTALGFLSPGYSQMSDEMSYLVYGPSGKLQTVNFILCGILTIGLALLLTDYPGSAARGAFYIQASAWVLGVSLVLLRVFPT